MRFGSIALLSVANQRANVQLVDKLNGLATTATLRHCPSSGIINQVKRSGYVSVLGIWAIPPGCCDKCFNKLKRDWRQEATFGRRIDSPRYAMAPPHPPPKNTASKTYGYGTGPYCQFSSTDPSVVPAARIVGNNEPLTI